MVQRSRGTQSGPSGHSQALSHPAPSAKSIQKQRPLYYNVPYIIDIPYINREIVAVSPRLLDFE
jgi:hypothetical protein